MKGMKVKTRKIIFFDIDDTLYDATNRIVPASTVAALDALSSREDVLLAIATGRGPYMLGVIEPIRRYFDVLVTLNGRLIYHGDACLHDDPMPEADVRGIKRLFEQSNLLYGMLGKYSHGINAMNDYIASRFDAKSLPLPELDPDLHKRMPIYQLWAFTSSEPSIDVPEGYRVVPWFEEGFDVLHAKKNKEDGIGRVLQAFDIPLSRAYAFGDGNNDCEMLGRVPHSVAMGNAAVAAKERASHVTARVDEDGIRKGLEHLGFL